MFIVGARDIILQTYTSKANQRDNLFIQENNIFITDFGPIMMNVFYIC